MVLRNFITLERDSPALLHFASVARERREITDPNTGQPKTLTVLAFQVDELNGVPVEATFSVTSEKLAQTLEPWISAGSFRRVNFRITLTGSGFGREYTVQTQPRAG